MGLPKIKFVKDQPPKVVVPLVTLKAGLHREATLDLASKEGSISIKLGLPGLSPQAVNVLMNAVDNDGFITIQVMPPEDASGKGKDNDQPRQ